MPAGLAMTDGLRSAYARPFAVQVAALRLRLRNLMPSATWEQIDRAEHERAFMVAGALKADLLADLAAAVDRAQSQGGTLESFRKDFRAIVEQRGWHGWTGEGTKGGEAWRTKVIYKTNMATSWAAGNMAQLVDLKYKFWVYRHGGSLDPRIQHLAWDGVALPPDHPFWLQHAPPNGWGCSCRIRGADNDAGIRRAGGDPNKQLPDGWQATDPRTGGQVGIDKGWNYKVGAGVAAEINAMTEKTVHWPYEIAKAYMADVPEAVRDAFSQGFRTLPSLGDAISAYVKRAPDSGADPFRTLGLLTSAQAKEIERLTGQPVQGFDFALDKSGIGHVMRKHSDKVAEAARGQIAIEAEDFVLIPAILEKPDAVESAGLSQTGLPALKYTKTIAGQTYTVIMEVRGAKRRMIVLKSMYARRATG